MSDIQDVKVRLQALEIKVQSLAEQVQEMMAIKEVKEASQAISTVLDIKKDELMSRLILLEQKVRDTHI